MSPRQEKILHAIVEYYVQTANPVGSLGLSQKFSYSPATIRAEMAILEGMGYIAQPHTSAGRIPTDKGYRWYVDQLKQETRAKLQAVKASRQSRAIDSRIDAAGEPAQAVKSAVDTLVEVTNNLAVGTIGNSLYMSGLAHLFSQPEFENQRRIQEVASLLDNLEPWLREISPSGRVNVYIGNENPMGKASGCALIISRFASPYSDYSYVGVVGPTRQSYPKVMNLVEHVGSRLEEVLNA